MEFWVHSSSILNTNKGPQLVYTLDKGDYVLIENNGQTYAKKPTSIINVFDKDLAHFKYISTTHSALSVKHKHTDKLYVKQKNRFIPIENLLLGETVNLDETFLYVPEVRELPFITGILLADQHKYKKGKVKSIDWVKFNYVKHILNKHNILYRVRGVSLQILSGTTEPLLRILIKKVEGFAPIFESIKTLPIEDRYAMLLGCFLRYANPLTIDSKRTVLSIHLKPFDYFQQYILGFIPYFFKHFIIYGDNLLLSLEEMASVVKEKVYEYFKMTKFLNFNLSETYVVSKHSQHLNKSTYLNLDLQEGDIFTINRMIFKYGGTDASI